MKKNLPATIFFFAMFLSNAVFAQLKKGSVKAKVVHTKTNLPVEFASVSVISLKDSTVVQSTVSDAKGLIEISRLDFGSYQLNVVQLGLKKIILPFSVSATKPLADLETIQMEPGNIALNEVLVKGEKVPVTIKKDTIEFNAGSYKTQPNDNVEELIKKLPGVDVDKDGKITSQGKQVSKMLVDGKEFFGGDPKAATKNLPADAIDKVQIIDDKTDKAKNTGIDDGQREKVMNITLKADKKKGWFGNAALAAGTSDRYLGQLSLNRFDNKKQFSLIGLSNNVNESGFTLEDLNNFAGGDAFNAFASNDGSTSINISNSGRVNINGAFSGVNGGLIKTHSGGLNFYNEYGKKNPLKFNASFIAVLSDNIITQVSNIQDPITNGYLYTNQNSSGNNSNNNYRLNLNFDYKLDSLTNIKFKPTFSTSNRSNISGTSSSLFSEQGQNTSSNQSFNQHNNSPAAGGQLTVNHRFPKGKGSLNFFTTGNYSKSNSNYINQSVISTYVTSTNRSDSSANNQTNQNNSTRFINSTITFNRQLIKKAKLNLILGQTLQYRNDVADQLALEYNAVTGRYELLVPKLSGLYNNQNYRYSTTAGLNKGGEKLTASLNLDIADVGLKGDFNNNAQSSIVTRNTWALVPSASLSYREKNGKSIYFNVRSDVTLPSVNNLQPVFNNTNPLYIRLGNPDLKISRSYSANANYSKFDFKTNTYFNFYANFTQTQNGFSTENFVNAQLVQTSRPINTNGNYNSYFGLNVGKPTKIKGLKVNFGLSGGFNRNVNFINGNENAVSRLSPNANLGFSYDKDRFQISARTYVTYNNSKNSFQKSADNDYYSLNNNYKISAEPVKTWRIFSEMNQSNYLGQENIPNTSVYLLNAGLEKFFMKNRQLSLSLTGFDLLKQNSGLQRNISATGRIEASQTNTIGQYFYLKINYKLTKLGGGKSNSNNNIIIF